mmetsp:Transcript_38587/g.56743  ORF Transcript_38587/g.56743 Transcript_38587/m.56743 type:complete len:88 (-) Transcript_38587:14-277(-)
MSGKARAIIRGAAAAVECEVAVRPPLVRKEELRPIAKLPAALRGLKADPDTRAWAERAGPARANSPVAMRADTFIFQRAVLLNDTRC